MSDPEESIEVVIDLEQFPEIPSDVPLAITDRRHGPGHIFRFALNRKQTTLGRLDIDQYWMDKRGLYGERNKESENRREAINLFWALCLCAGSALNDRGVQESYVLARLLQHSRSNGSRRVFADSSMEYRCPPEMIVELNQILLTDKDKKMGASEFHRQTAEILGPPEYTQQERDQYDEMVSELMDTACSALTEGDLQGYFEAENRWVNYMQTIGRRSGKQLEKCVLDILSYEARAAFHRCYSQAWQYILLQLSRQFQLSNDSLLFHKLWHLDQAMPANETNATHFHLFHGHIFGLHPAGADFIRTAIGQEILGDLILNPEDDNYHQKFLNGFCLACYQYADRHQVSKELRRQSAQNMPDNFFNSLQAGDHNDAD
ncbi:hypothetical protein [Gimesia chilikensis]|uniref:hypothetical protein n=1 Tax=Gimesia chilikensis TaxID=2605989 RepID=UPI001188033E|nr:hypothetical protein [Gimesia chilikensis]QDT87387.1 hypothetical protein MalM14_50720 [Gimesia chilikensis]